MTELPAPPPHESAAGLCADPPLPEGACAVSAGRRYAVTRASLPACAAELSCPGALAAVLAVLRGEAVLRQGERTMRIRADSFAVASLSAPLGLYVPEGAEAAWITMTPDEFLFRTGYAVSRVEGTPCALRSPVGRCFKGALRGVLAAAGESLPIEIDALCAALLGFLSPALARERRKRIAPALSRRDKLRSVSLSFMQAHYTDPGLSLGQIAGAAGVSSRHLSDLYRELGVSVMGCLRDIRLSAAAGMLCEHRNVHLPVAAVAANCGFASSAHFCRLFRKRFGLTPGKYRESRGEHPEKSI